MTVGSKHALLIIYIYIYIYIYIVNAYVLPNNVNIISIIIFCVLMYHPKKNINMYIMFVCYLNMYCMFNL